MRTLVYKRTHVADPDAEGRFGVFDCMGRIRGYEFDAVIGIGATGSEAESYGIDRKLCWIGLTPHSRPPFKKGYQGPLLTFDHFLNYGNAGPLLVSVAPHLAERIFGPRPPRYLLDRFTDAELAEIKRLLRRAKNAPPSGPPPKCPPRKRRC
jgi:hypothetical protein